MIKHLLYILFLVFSLVGCAQMNPEPKQITQLFFPENESIPDITPALQKKKGFTDYKELIDFVNALKTSHTDLVTINYIGETQNGLQIPMLIINDKNAKTDKIKVFFQGGLHGNEPASTEGLLYLMHEFLNNKQLAYLHSKITLAVIPMANIDGSLKLDRLAANGLDLNRDQTKLMAPESMALKKAFSDFNPQVALDFHEYNAFRKDFAKMSTFGIANAFDVMFLYSSNLNVPKNIRQTIDTLFVENVRQIMDKNNLRHFDYMSTAKLDNLVQFNRGSVNPRSSASSFALSNCVSLLLEVRGVNLGRTSFKRRINTTYLAGLSFLESSYKHADFVKKEIETAQQSTADIVLKSKRKQYEESVPVIDLNTKSIINLPIKISDAKGSTPTLIRQRPQAYLLDKSLEHLIPKIEALGIKVNKIFQTQKFDVEAYVIKSFEKDAMPYEKLIMQTVETELQPKNIEAAIGSYLIEVNQKNAPLLFEVLEPEASSSFVSFGLIKTQLNDVLPIYRVVNKN